MHIKRRGARWQLLLATPPRLRERRGVFLVAPITRVSASFCPQAGRLAFFLSRHQWHPALHLHQAYSQLKTVDQGHGSSVEVTRTPIYSFSLPWRLPFPGHQGGWRERRKKSKVHQIYAWECRLNWMKRSEEANGIAKKQISTRRFGVGEGGGISTSSSQVHFLPSLLASLPAPPT